MSSFTEPLTVTKIDSKTWRIARAFRYYVGEEDSDDFIDIPEGFETDFASVPRPFWIIFPPDGKYTQSAVLHDYLYGIKGENGKRSRKECDDIFLEAMKILGVDWHVRYPMYFSVRAFGWIPWKN